jgi:uncharacterized protein (DUF697 family)
MVIDSALRLAKASQDVWQGIARVDRAAAKRRVEAMRERHPEATSDELQRALTLSKCIQVGAVAGVARLAGLLPGSGALARTLLGRLAEDSLLTMLQAELIVETFDVYGVELPRDAERLAVTALAGTHAGARHAGLESARVLAASIQRALGRGATRLAAPVAAALTGALSEIALTYAIGMRAQALAKMPRARAAEWPDLIRQFVQFDERRLAAWTTGAARDALALAAQVGHFWLGRVRDVVGPLTAPAAPSSRKKRQPTPAARPASRRARPVQTKGSDRNPTEPAAAAPGTRTARGPDGRAATRTRRAPRPRRAGRVPAQ